MKHLLLEKFMDSSREVQRIINAYGRRSSLAGRYSFFNASSYLAEQEKERCIINCLISKNLLPVDDKKVLEIGAGSGNNMLFLLKLGFKSKNLIANELLPERIEILKERLPGKTLIIQGNALELSLQPQSIDLVFQSMVFTSILDKEFKEALALKLWSFIKPGGGLIWYDFTYDNPRNPDVKGIKIDELRTLFKDSEITSWRITLAPPLARLIKEYPRLYNILNLFPFLRTHLLCWIRKK